MAQAPIRTTCPYCGVGCGVLATPQPDGSVAIAGDPDHPANFGRLCSKGTALGETLDLDGRLLYPQIRGERADWDAALDLVAQRFSETIRDHGPDSVAFYVSGQLLTEDYYVANKLMKGFIGSGNIDTNSRLCMASSVAGHRRAFGADTVPGTYADLDNADLVVLTGSNFAWCHPVLFQRLLKARETRGTRIIVIDPRRTMTAEAADLHLALAPDSDLPLYLGLLAHLERNGAANHAYLSAYIGDPEPALAGARDYSIARVAAECELNADDVDQFYDLFTRTERVVSVYSQGINQSISGSDKVNAILNCHLYTGRIGREGMGPFSITGQPNAMGGREVGGLANMLAAHMEIENPDHRALVQRFWNSPVMAEKQGLKAVDMFDAVRKGRIKALWIMATNPVDSLPDAGTVDDALAACPFVVVSDVMRQTDTTRHAHVLLPALGWGEKDGTVTNSERRISRQRGFLPAPGEARADWWQLAEVAKRMGFSGFDYASARDVFAEHAALSGSGNAGSRDFDISAHAEISSPAYDALTPFQWPQRKGEVSRETRFFSEGGFYTPDGRARMLALSPRVSLKKTSAEFPLWLNTGRIRDQWHTMTRTGKAARLMGHYGEPFCEIHPNDARQAGIQDAALVRVSTMFGDGVFRALIVPRQREGSVFVPMHWSDQFANAARINKTVHPACDPVSGQPGLKATAARIEAVQPRWYGFAVSRAEPKCPDISYWALSRATGGFRIELAGDTDIADWQDFARTLFDIAGPAEWAALYDTKAKIVRLACVQNGRLAGALFIAPEPVALARGFVSAALEGRAGTLNPLALLAGKAGADRPDPGPILCACFSVGVNEIARVLENGQATNVDAVGALLKAGTNCGSCRAEIARMISSAASQTSAVEPPEAPSRVFQAVRSQ